MVFCHWLFYILIAAVFATLLQCLWLMKKSFGNSGMRNQAPRPVIDAIIIGFEKTGTEALARFLELHSQVKMADMQVQDLESLLKLASTLSNKIVGFYYTPSLLPKDSEKVFLADYPTGMNKKTTPEVISRLLPDVKLILSVRNPVERSISHFVHLQHLNRDRLDKTQVTGEIMILKQKLNMTFPEKAFNWQRMVNKNSIIVWLSLYAERLVEWFKYFPITSFHIVNGDNLKKAPFIELHKVEKFLGVSHELEEERFYLNATKGFYCIKKTPGDHVDGLCLGSDKGRIHPYVSWENRTKLAEFFRPYNQEFFNLVGHRFDWNMENY